MTYENARKAHQDILELFRKAETTQDIDDIAEKYRNEVLSWKSKPEMKPLFYVVANAKAYHRKMLNECYR